MKRLCQICATLILAATVICASVIMIRNAEAHPNVTTITDVREHCYLVGYPSKTLCQTNKFRVFEAERSGDDHMGVLDPRANIIFIDHRPGRAGHDTEERGPFRKTTSRLVFNDCGECN